MLTYPNAKINLGLFITGRLPDGFHTIETVLVPVPSLCDALEVIPRGRGRGVRFAQTGLAVPSPPALNLCVRAYHLLARHTALPPVAMHLHKQIPMGAGLGGGSADGAFALRMLNAMAAAPVPVPQLAELALELGSDCPFFLSNMPSFASGRGQALDPLPIPALAGMQLLLVNPGVHVATGGAYALASPRGAPVDLRRALAQPVERWGELVANDFEPIVFSQHPQVEVIKTQLYELGALFASMSGSGSTVYGIFRHRPPLDRHFDGMFTHRCSL